VPGKVLAAGTYVFKLGESSANRHIVQIFNQDHTELITTVLAIPNQRLEPAGKTILTYEERPSNQPMALRAWFYPGDNFGQQFVYPKTQAEELSRLNKMEVPSGDADETANKKAERTEAETAKNTAPSSDLKAENTPPPSPAASAPAAPSQPAPTPAPTQERTKRLPKTGSSLPLYGLMGFLLCGVATLLRKTLQA
jgi:LPXTG-motif cell wall-anchored protein